MGVHNLSEYVAYHQAKLRREQEAAAAAAAPSKPTKKYSGVNSVRSRTSFQNSVVDGSNDSLVVLDCFATWCGPCKAIAPKIVEFSEQYSNVQFYKIDVDAAGDVAQELGVRAMPTFYFFKDGEKVGEVVGANPGAIKAAIEKYQ